MAYISFLLNYLNTFFINHKLQNKEKQSPISEFLTLDMTSDDWSIPFLEFLGDFDYRKPRGNRIK